MLLDVVRTLGGTATRQRQEDRLCGAQWSVPGVDVRLDPDRNQNCHGGYNRYLRVVGGIAAGRVFLVKVSIPTAAPKSNLPAATHYLAPDCSTCLATRMTALGDHQRQ